MQKRALRFADDTELQATLGAIAELAARGPVAYNIVPDAPIVVVPPWMYELLVPLLHARGIAYADMTVLPFSTLPPKKQAELRGLHRGTSE